MASGYNRVILMGNLTRDPELRYTPSGTAVSDLRLAVSTQRGRGNDRQEDTVFVDVTVWDRQAETCCEYLAKGRPVLVEGRLRMDEWEDRESGQKRSKLCVTASNVQFLGGGGDGGGSGGGGGGGRRGGGTGGGGGGGSRGGGSDRGREDNRREPDNLDEDFSAADDVPF